MSEKNLSFDENIKLYSEKVLKPFWKNNKFSNISSWSSPGESPNSFEATTSVYSDLLNGTTLEYKGPFKFLHFTSITNLISMLKSRSIRLYDFNNFNDPTELTFSHKYFKLHPTEYDLTHYKRQFFGFSMCAYSQDFIENNINLWRLYGNNGEGVCIVLSIDPFSISKIYNYSFGKINYVKDSNKIQEFEDIIERDKWFNEQYNFSCENLADVIAPLCCFYKSSLFEIENEVRLFHYQPLGAYGSIDYKNILKSEINRHGRKVLYHELPLTTVPNHTIPQMKIDMVYLGYNLNAQTLDDTFEVIKETDFPYNFDIKVSPIKSKLTP